MDDPLYLTTAPFKWPPFSDKSLLQKERAQAMFLHVLQKRNQRHTVYSWLWRGLGHESISRAVIESDWDTIHRLAAAHSSSLSYSGVESLTSQSSFTCCCLKKGGIDARMTKYQVSTTQEYTCWLIYLIENVVCHFVIMTHWPMHCSRLRHWCETYNPEKQTGN